MVLHSLGVEVVDIRVQFSEAKGWHGEAIFNRISLRGVGYLDRVTALRAGRAAEDYFGYAAHDHAWMKDAGEISVILDQQNIPESEQFPTIIRADEAARRVFDAYGSRTVSLINLLELKGHVGSVEFTNLMSGIELGVAQSLDEC